MTHKKHWTIPPPHLYMRTGICESYNQLTINDESVFIVSRDLPGRWCVYVYDEDFIWYIDDKDCIYPHPSLSSFFLVNARCQISGVPEDQ